MCTPRPLLLLLALVPMPMPPCHLLPQPYTIPLFLQGLLLPRLHPDPGPDPPLPLHGRGTIHHLRNQIPIDRVARHFERRRRTLAVVIVAFDRRRAAYAHTIGASVAQCIAGRTMYTQYRIVRTPTPTTT